jgi:hypothetical protein
MRYLLAPLRFVLIAVFLPITACMTDDTIDITFDPCSPLTIVPGADTEQHELQSIEEALVAWDRVLPTRISVGTAAGGDGEIGDGELPISFEDGDTFYRAIYFDKWGEILISREKLAPEDYALAVAHELGHAFGLFHVPAQERASIMNVGNLDIVPSADDAFAVSALWDSCRQ